MGAAGVNLASQEPAQVWACELSIVVPTFRESESVAELVRRLQQCLAGIAWEVVFVDDDSPDGTADTVRSLAARHGNVRCVQRIGRRGLSSACVEGVLATSAPIVAVMDADLQHDERILPEMLRRLREDAELDIVVGSRYVDGGSVGDWDAQRASISRIATRLSRFVVPQGLKDPMSGFFMIRRASFMRCVRKLSALGFKILVDIFASAPRALRFCEVAYTFRHRHAGESKLDSQVAWHYLMLLIDKSIGHIVPARFVAFGLIGASGVLVHMLVLSTLLKAAALPFQVGQTLATVGAMVFNFAVNNLITYRDRRLHGWQWWRGLVSFMLACSVGAVANVGIASFLFGRDGGWVIAALSGILVGAVWNYAITSIYTWGRRG